jgi:peptidoglycan/LPS O-acetylase OafA/YrhL
MPLFMFLSGYVFFRANYQERALDDKWTYFKRRTDRLLTPFFVMAAVLLLAKTVTAPHLYVDAPPPSLLQGVVSIFWNTTHSPVFTVWYLWVLWAFSMVTPVLWPTLGKSKWALAALGLAAYAVTLPDVLYADRVAEFFIFFAAGGIAAEHAVLEKPMSPLLAIVATGGLAALLYLFTERRFGLLFCGLTACIAVPALLQQAPRAATRALAFFGKRSMSIYLLNVPCIGGTKAVVLAISLYDPSRFLPFAGLLFVAGVALPIATLELLKWLKATVVVKYLS